MQHDRDIENDGERAGASPKRERRESEAALGPSLSCLSLEVRSRSRSLSALAQPACAPKDDVQKSPTRSLHNRQSRKAGVRQAAGPRRVEYTSSFTPTRPWRRARQRRPSGCPATRSERCGGTWGRPAREEAGGAAFGSAGRRLRPEGVAGTHTTLVGVTLARAGGLLQAVLVRLLLRWTRTRRGGQQELAGGSTTRGSRTDLVLVVVRVVLRLGCVQECQGRQDKRQRACSARESLAPGAPSAAVGRTTRPSPPRPQGTAYGSPFLRSRTVPPVQPST